MSTGGFVGLGSFSGRGQWGAGVNEDSVVPMARHFRGSGHIVRVIEYMDVGHSHGWRMDEVVPAAEIVAMIDAEMPLEPVAPNYPGEVVERWRYRDGSGEIGVIASVTRPFCGGCTRARLSAEGRLFTCLFAVAGHDLRALLRDGASDAETSAAIGGIWRMREDRYSELRTAATAACRRSRCPTSRVGHSTGSCADSGHARLIPRSPPRDRRRAEARASVRTRSGPRPTAPRRMFGLPAVVGAVHGNSTDCPGAVESGGGRVGRRSRRPRLA
jgi:Molybdenum Cofactor Synthesis C